MNEEDFVLKTQIVPPICPGYPSVINEQFQDDTGVQNVYDEDIDGNKYDHLPPHLIVNNSISNIQIQLLRLLPPSFKMNQAVTISKRTTSTIVQCPPNDSSKAEIERLKPK